MLDFPLSNAAKFDHASLDRSVVLYCLAARLYFPQSNNNNVLTVFPRPTDTANYGSLGPPGNPIPKTTPATSSENVCGWWLEGQKTSRWICSSSCAVATYTTPNILFCPQNEVQPYTEFFAYGQWPQRGCQGYQWCCGKDQPFAVRFDINNGATVMSVCLPSTRNDPILTQTFVTQLGSLSARHSTYTPPYSLASATSLVSASSNANSRATSSPTDQSTPSGQPTSLSKPPEEKGLNTEAKVGLGVGVPGAVVAVGTIVAYCWKKLIPRG